MTPNHKQFEAAQRMTQPVTFTIQCAGVRAQILADGEPTGQWYSVGRAKERAAELQESGAYKRRSCMCCAAVFVSEGPHNRLCVVCRRQGASAETVAV